MDILERFRKIRENRNLSQEDVSGWYKLKKQARGAKERGEIAGFSLMDIQLYIEKMEIDARWLFGQIDCPIGKADS